MRTVRVEVTAEDIAQGIKNDCLDCPIALALKRAGVGGVAVDGDVLAKWEDGSNFLTRVAVCALPQAAQDFIDEFDSGHDVEPFSFDVELP